MYLSVTFLTNTQRTFNDQVKNRSGAISTVNTLITIHGNLVGEHFNKETKGKANRFPFLITAMDCNISYLFKTAYDSKLKNGVINISQT